MVVPTTFGKTRARMDWLFQRMRQDTPESREIRRASPICLGVEFVGTILGQRSEVADGLPILGNRETPGLAT